MGLMLTPAAGRCDGRLGAGESHLASAAAGPYTLHVCVPNSCLNKASSDRNVMAVSYADIRSRGNRSNM